ncbi:MAG TPA: condensation domain-containing protein, partial [Acidimicrobiales bacterium]
MRFTDIRDHELPTGHLTIWVASEETQHRAQQGPVDPRRPSHNQQGHIARAMARRVDPDLRGIVPDPTGDAGKAAPTGWLGLRFDVPPTSAHGLRRSFETWVRRHETLRSGFRPSEESPDGAGFERFTVPPEDIAIEPLDLGYYGDPTALADRLDDLFNESTDAICWPAYVFATIWTPKATTVLMAFDHLNVDGYSILLMAAELREVVDADREGRPLALPPVPSYLDFVEDERDDAALASVTHDAVDQWRSFLGERRDMPSFPLADGLAPGSQVPQGSCCIPILDEAEALAFGTWCRASGISAGTGFLGALTLAFTRLAREAGVVDPAAPELDRFRVLVSTHTRHDARWAEALGWFTAVAPFDVSVPTGHELGDILPTLNAAWADAKRGAALPLSRIGELLGRTLEPRFLVSYLDARHARGANLWPYWRAHAFIGDVGPTDQVYAWINRMPNETYLTWRYP